MKLLLSRSDAVDTPWLNDRLLAELTRIASMLEPEGAAIDVTIVDDRFIRDVNRRYRGVDRPTDVISFSYIEDGASPVDEDDPVGEVYLSSETLEKDAKQQGIEPGNLFLRIGIHGLLHVIGYDHQTGTDAERMEREERRLLLRCLPAVEVEKLFS